MTSKAFGHTMRWLLALLVSVTLTGCFDYDDASAEQGANFTDDFSLAFDISLNTIPGSSTRADGNEYVDEYDNMVDVEGNNHDFRVLLFDADDNFLYEPDRREIEPIGKGDYKNTGVQTNRWRITMPIMALKRRGLWEKIAEHSFKIAVLANWPRSAADSPLEFKQGDKLYKISHYWVDNVYGSTSTAQQQAYSFLSENGKMGAYVQWVNNTYSDTVKARSAIRDREEQRDLAYQLNRVVGPKDYTHTYEHIWRVWNFGDESLLNGLTTVERFRTFWKINNVDKANLQSLDSSGLENYKPTTDNSKDGLTFGENGSYAYEDNCIKLNQGLTSSAHTSGEALPKTCLKFDAYAAGTLLIWAKSNSSNTTYIGIQQGDYSELETRAKNRNVLTGDKKVGEEMTNQTKMFLHQISVSVTGTSNEHIPGDPVPVYVYAVDGNVSIYQIEYIEDDHLYNTDRKGFLPTKDKLIPMYGIQEFGAIGGYLNLEKGETFNLSESEGADDEYERKKVHLLRSVAKVELRIPIGYPKLTHAYLRSANRHGRCEPVDISTPTDILWNGGLYRGKTYSNIDQEIEYIKNYGIFYDSTTEDYGKYRTRLSWFYKAWEGTGANWTTENKEWTNNTIKTTVSEKNDYPHIFNTRINRSDYIHFQYAGQKDLCDCYVLYVPEKNIDDPNSHGKMKSTPPKIPHIELRFEKNSDFKGNDDTNLDDNDCYRIYFTPYNDRIPTKNGGYDDIEYKSDNNILGQNILYPIVRNHVYRFTVTGIDDFEYEGITVTVGNTAEPTDWETDEWGFTLEPEL